jgi:hypothetical protein
VVAVLRSDLGGVFALLALICFTAARNNSRVDLVDAYSWGSCQMITAVRMELLSPPTGRHLVTDSPRGWGTQGRSLAIISCESCVMGDISSDSQPEQKDPLQQLEQLE